MHPSPISPHIRNTFEPFPRLRVLGHQEKLREDAASLRNSFQQASAAKGLAISTETMIDQYHRKRRRVFMVLAEQCVVAGDAVGAQKRNGKPLCAMFFTEIRVSFQHFQKPNGAAATLAKCLGAAVLISPGAT